MVWNKDASVTEERRAVGLFVDRVQFIRCFMRYLQADPPFNTILFVQGDGGHGKTLLLRYLRDHCCKRFDPRVWTGLQALDDDAFKARVASPTNTDGSSAIVPACLIDFRASGTGYRPQDAYDVLLTLQHDLAKYHIQLPLFNAALRRYLKDGLNKSEGEIKSLLPTIEMDLVAEVANVASHAIPWYHLGKAAAAALEKRMGPRLRPYLERRKLSSMDLLERLVQIETMDPRSDLRVLLPTIFAEDLRAGLGHEKAPPCVALFFDTHEAFSGQDHLQSDDQLFAQDEWLRRLLKPLVERPCGAVIVVAGRDALRWPEATDTGIEIRQEYIDAHLLGGLPDAYACTYLQQPGIDIFDVALQKSILEFARFTKNEIHPLHLGLAADIVLAARVKGTELTAAEFNIVPDRANKNSALLRRLLRWVNQELAAAVTPSAYAAALTARSTTPLQSPCTTTHRAQRSRRSRGSPLW